MTSKSGASASAIDRGLRHAGLMPSTPLPTAGAVAAANFVILRYSQTLDCSREPDVMERILERLRGTYLPG